MKSNWKSLLLLFGCFISVLCQFTTSTPNWLTSPYFKADSQQVISSPTSSNVPASTYSFTFSSAFLAQPKLGYGIKQYKGYDRLTTEKFQIKRIGLNASYFQVSVEIVGGTTVMILQVAYIAIDKNFPHHFNTFDNVPINYTSGDLTGITGNELTIRSFTEVINYTSQASALTHNSFQLPLSRNKILLFLTTFFQDDWFTNGIFYPQSFKSEVQIINSSHYSITATIYPNNQIYKLHFSQIMFDELEIQNSNLYQVVYIQYSVPGSTGGTIPIPGEFKDNFIMALTDFNASIADCGIFYQWVFDVPNNQITLYPSVKLATAVSSCGLQYVISVILYIKTWKCPITHPYYNLTSSLCQDTCSYYHYINNLTLTNISCYPCLYNCYQCSINSPLICTNCDANASRVLLNGTCSCLSGFYQNYTTNSQCLQCNLTIPNCLTCISISTTNTNCQQCQTQYYVTNNSCSLCSSTIANCNTCSQDGIICHDCAINYEVSSTGNCSQCFISCDCDGYTMPMVNNRCSTICGDGILKSTEQCDDGNTIDSDGCSSKCVIQPNWKCLTPSKCCEINVGLNLTMESLTKIVNLNSIKVKLKISPIFQIFTSQSSVIFGVDTVETNLSQIVSCKQVFYNKQSGCLQILLEYNSTIHGKSMQIKLSPKLPPSSLNCSPNPISVTLVVALMPSNTMGLLYYQPHQYQQYQTVQSIFKSIQVISYILFICGFISCKIIGIELMGVLQLAFFTLSNYDYVNIILYSLTSFKSLNGLNFKITNQQLNSKLPARVESLGYSVLFIDNCNLMMLIVTIVLIIGISAYYITKLFSFTYFDKIHKLSKHILKQVLITLILFNAFNFAYSATIQYNYATTTQPYYPLSTAMAIFSNILPLSIMIALAFTDKQQFGEFKNKMKKDCLSQGYFIITLGYRIALGCFIASLNEKSIATLLIFPIAISYMVYFLVNLPFKQALHNYRAGMCHTTIFISLFVTMYYRSMKSIYNSGKQFQPAYIEIVSIMLSLLISAVTFIYEILVFIQQILISKAIANQQQVQPVTNNSMIQ